MEETVETSDSIELTQEEKDALAVQMNHIETAKQEKLRKAKDSMIKKKVSIIKSILLLVDTQIDYYSKQKDDSEEETKKHTDALTSLREIISRNFDELVTILDGEDHPMVDTIRINLSSIDSIIKQFTPEQKKDYIVVLKDTYVKLEDYNQLATLVLEMKEELDNTKSRLAFINQKVSAMYSRSYNIDDKHYEYFKKRSSIDLSNSIDKSLMQSIRRIAIDNQDERASEWAHLDLNRTARQFNSGVVRQNYNEMMSPLGIVQDAYAQRFQGVVDSNTVRPSEIEPPVPPTPDAPPF